MSGGPAVHHTLTVLVENRAGVLARVSGLFARRGYNIVSLAVAPTDDERFSRITIVVDVEQTSVEQITKQLFKLVNVVKISELAPADAVERELLLATVATAPEVRSQVLELVTIFGGKIVDVGRAAVTVMLAGHPAKLDDLEDLLRPYGITELQRTGRVALPRLDRQGPPRVRVVRGKAS
ncbi:MAG TPA: acetolactate synthase small subunit [Acidimicrobiales bacterium]|nr:acetolactate synthase small subunit [Acidimicrobiales bacterium]